MLKQGLGIIALLLVVGCESNTFVEGSPVLQVPLAGSAGAAGADLGGEAGLGEGGSDTGGAATGGRLPTGGSVTGGAGGSTGGVVQTGGNLPTGGFAGSTGGSLPTGGAVTGGTAGSTGGVVQTGGNLPTGGFAGSTGGSPETGGAGGAGGSLPVGGAETGGTSTGGAPTQKVVFLTSSDEAYKVPFIEQGTFPPGTTNVQAADIICQREAEAGGLTGRNFQAWLPTSTATAQERIDGDGPWYRTDGWGPVFADWDALAGNPSYPINRTADGTLISYGVNVWGENRSGVEWAGTCEDYASYYDGVEYLAAMIGEQTYTDERWTSREGGACNTPRAFYCFEI